MHNGTLAVQTPRFSWEEKWDLQEWLIWPSCVVSKEVITGRKILKYPVVAFPSWQTVSFCWPANAMPWKPPSSVSKHPQWPGPCPPHWVYRCHTAPGSLGISALLFPSHVSWTPQAHSCEDLSCIFLQVQTAIPPDLQIAGEPQWSFFFSWGFSSNVFPDLHNSSSTYTGSHFLSLLLKTLNYPKINFMFNLFCTFLSVFLADNIVNYNLHGDRSLSISLTFILQRPNAHYMLDDPQVFCEITDPEKINIKR